MNDKKYLTYGGIFAGIHLLMMILSRFLVGSEIILIVFLPLLSALYFIKMNWKSSVKFVFATFLLCAVFDPISTLLYIFPSLLVGSFYGFLYKKKFKQLEIVYLTSLIHFITIFSSFVFLDLVFDFAFLEFIKNTFEFVDPFLPASIILIALSFIQSFATHLVVSKELTRFNYYIEKEEKTPLWFLVSMIFFTSLFIFLRILKNEYSIVLILIISVFAIPYLIQGALNIKHKVLTYVGFVFSSLVFIYFLGSIPAVYTPLLFLFLLSPLVVNVDF